MVVWVIPGFHAEPFQPGLTCSHASGVLISDSQRGISGEMWVGFGFRSEIKIPGDLSATLLPMAKW
jgi:hypothetical protein